MEPGGTLTTLRGSATTRAPRQAPDQNPARLIFSPRDTRSCTNSSMLEVTLRSCVNDTIQKSGSQLFPTPCPSITRARKILSSRCRGVLPSTAAANGEDRRRRSCLGQGTRDAG
jgi:hypothetical protein